MCVCRVRGHAPTSPPPPWLSGPLCRHPYPSNPTHPYPSQAEEELEGLADDLDLLAGDSDEELGIAGAGLSSEGEEDDVEEEDGGEEDGEEGGKKKKPIKFADIRKKIKEVDALSEDPDVRQGEAKARNRSPQAGIDCSLELATGRNELERGTCYG